MQTKQLLLIGAVLTILGSAGMTRAEDAKESKSERITTKVVEYKDGDQVFEGFLACPRKVKGHVPGVLVIHEWWGLNDYARQRARQLAEAGYVAFAADMYGKGRRSDTFDGAAKLSGELKADRPLLRHRGELALQVLRDQPQVDTNRLAAIGYCFGGLSVLELARDGADLVGVVSFHGTLDTTLPAKPGTVKAKVLVCHGAADPFTSAADITTFEHEMTAAGVDWQMDIFGGAVHGFTNPQAGNDPSKGMAYNAAADHRSWQQMRDFFREIFGK